VRIPLGPGLKSPIIRPNIRMRSTLDCQMTIILYKQDGSIYVLLASLVPRFHGSQRMSGSQIFFCLFLGLWNHQRLEEDGHPFQAEQ
jgi:hypothetical protein